MKALASVLVEASIRIDTQPGGRLADSIAIYMPDSDTGQGFFDTYEIGPFDTNMDVACWIVKSLIRAKVMRAI